MKKQIISFDLKKSTLFVFKSKKSRSGFTPTVTATDPTNGTATSHTSSVITFPAG